MWEAIATATIHSVFASLRTRSASPNSTQPAASRCGVSTNRLLALLFVVAATACSSSASEPLKAEGGWSIIMVPDTQYYAAVDPEVFDLQTEWIANHVGDLNIRMVLHVGDLVDANRPGQWENARQSMKRLDGVVPYVIVPGNHDIGITAPASDRSTLMNDFFPVDAPHIREHLIETFEPGRGDNTLHRIETPEGPWLVLGLEFGPRDAVLDWARDVLRSRADLPTIMLTHAFLHYDGTRLDHVGKPDQSGNPYHYEVASSGVNDAEEMWAKLVEPVSQIDLVLSGHVGGDGTGYLASERSDGTVAHQVVANYQDPFFPSGYLRIIRVKADRYEMFTYSPLLDSYLRDNENEFIIER